MPALTGSRAVGVSRIVPLVLLMVSLLCSLPAFAAYNLEVPVDPWDEYRLQFKEYSRHLLAAYDRAFADDYAGAVRELNKAIALLPDEGIGFAERAKYLRTMNDVQAADADYKKALYLFERAIERYRTSEKKGSKVSRRVSPGEAARLVATLRYQRGEAYFSFEQYRQAADDFASSCQAGNTLACARLWDVKGVEKRGQNWVPLLVKQFYDRQRVEKPARDLIRVWVRREDNVPAQAEAGQDTYQQQHIELKCSTREFRLIEAQAFTGNMGTMTERPVDSDYTKAIPGSSPGKLLSMLCSRPSPK